MKKIMFCFMFIISPLLIFSQEINIVSQDRDKTLITFESKDGTPVPIYNILSETSGNISPDTILFMKELELLGNTPLTLELQNGHYTFQMYKEGNNKFDIIASGNEQLWNLKPKGKAPLLGPVLTIAGGFGILGGIAMYSVTAFKKSVYETDLDFFDNPGEYSGLEYWHGHIVVGAMAGVIISGIITWIINTPKATQIK